MDTPVELAHRTPQKRLKHAQLGMLILLATELMFFTGAVSALWVWRSDLPEWPPFGMPVFPKFATGINSLILFTSGITMAIAVKNKAQYPKKILWITFILGSMFFLGQGIEWFQLFTHGLKSDNIYGGYFYLIVGGHALHVLAGLFLVLSLCLHENKNRLQFFNYYWYFVVGLWLPLYCSVYL
jgi:heme/copper-type cytochrome/quinol oxidase subunit 3